MNFILGLGLLLLTAASSWAAGGEALVAGYPVTEAFRLGEAIYQQGVLPSGEPVAAIVQGDIPVEGTMFTCVSCHLRSGLGSNEGSVVTPGTSWPKLDRDRPLGEAWKQPGTAAAAHPETPLWESLQDVHKGGTTRPAYTDATLATALRVGKDPTGAKFDLIMPRYLLGETDMALLIHYLKGLSREFSPGVDEETLRVATVVTEDVPTADRDAMLAVLREYVKDRNSQSRHEVRRAKVGPFSRQEMNVGYRKLDLSVWNLTGSPETWREQLEAYYAAKPVFALLGGISTRSWRPIHEFCEDRRIPCLLPLTDLPVISKTDWYTLYFSKGVYQEGEAAVRFLRSFAELPAGARVVQVYRRGGNGAVVARAVRETAAYLRRPAPEDRPLADGQPLTEAFWRDLFDDDRVSVLLAWLAPEDLPAVERVLSAPTPPRLVMASSSVLGGVRPVLSDDLRRIFYLTYPYLLDGQGRVKRGVINTWFRSRGIPADNFELVAKTYFLVKMVSGMLMDLRSEFYRDYFFDAIDMMIDQTYMIAVYPRLSFGPGQRYASKGCYVVQLGEGPDPQMLPRSEWVIH